MPYLQATSLHVSPPQQDLLEHVVRRTTSPQRLVSRARIILAAGAGISNTQIAKQVQVHYETVRRWRDRWGAAEPRLQA
jgi:DNA-binding NarL/FixJ family response regulator